ncbi:XRE family transcriptional regulator [bacterium]|nr:XRE family transcriptional regulator [bacterium]
MKRTNKTTEAKCTDFANTIYNIRKKRDITQKELADLIGVSDRTISKWENGSTVPDLETIKKLCNELGISPDSIVKSEKNYKDRLQDFKRMVGKFINYILKNIFLISFIVVFILLLAYFINNYNTIRIYNLTYESKNITFKDGYFFKTKVLNIITINNIKLEKINYEPTSTKIELYTYLNGDKHVIYESNSLNNIYIEESKSYSDLLTKDVIENIKNNLYIKVFTTDIDNNNYSYESKLILKQKLNNNKLCYNEYIKEQNKKIEDLGLQNPFLVLKENGYNMDSTKPVVESDNSINKLESLDFSYDGNTETYTKVDDDGGIIEYKPSSRIIKKERLDNDLKVTTRYVIDRKIVNYNISRKNNEIICDLQYLLQPDITLYITGKCKNHKSEIDYIIRIYNEIIKVLQ